MRTPFDARRAALAFAFAALGLAAGWATADLFCLTAEGGEAVLRGALLAVTPLAAAAIGGGAWYWLGARALKAAALVAALTLAVGAVTGAALASFTDSATHVRFHGMPSGLAAAAAIAPPMLLVFFAERGVARSRSGSVIGGVDRRAVVAAVAFAIAFGVVVAVPPWFVSTYRPHHPSPDGPLTFAILAIAALLVVLALDLRAVRVTRRAAVEVGTMTPRADESSEPENLLDLGVGEAWVERAVQPFGTYRGIAEVIASIRGDAVLARRIATRAVLRDVVAVALAVHAMSVAFTPGLAERARALFARPDAPAPEAVASPEDSIGIEACDEYFAELERCFEKNPTVKAAMADSAEQNRQAWKNAARMPAAREALQTSCRTATDALRASCK